MKKLLRAILILTVSASLGASVISCSKTEEEPEAATEAIVENTPEPTIEAATPEPQAEETTAPAAEEAANTDGAQAAAAPKGDAALGKAKFETICASCHGIGGKGDGVAAAALNPKPRDLSDAAYVSSLTNDHIFKVIKEGGPSVGKSPLMPAWGGALSDDDIHNVIAHIHKSLCNCESK
ncbi:MAG: c-type cytochrome [Deltaproteobacteria bacterium]